MGKPNFTRSCFLFHKTLRGDKREEGRCGGVKAVFTGKVCTSGVRLNSEGTSSGFVQKGGKGVLGRQNFALPKKIWCLVSGPTLQPDRRLSPLEGVV